MGGLSQRQRSLLALLMTVEEPVDVTGTLSDYLGLLDSRSVNNSLRRTIHLLEQRGLVETSYRSERVWPGSVRLYVSITGAGIDLMDAYVERRRRSLRAVSAPVSASTA